MSNRRIIEFFVFVGCLAGALALTWYALFTVNSPRGFTFVAGVIALPLYFTSGIALRSLLED